MLSPHISPALFRRFRRFFTVMVAATVLFALSVTDASASTYRARTVHRIAMHVVVKAKPKPLVKHKVVHAKKKPVSKKPPVKKPVAPQPPAAAPVPVPTPPPAPIPVQTPAPTPVPVPPSADYPNASNTGVPAGVALTAVPAQATSGAGWQWSGYSVVVTTPGAVLVGLDIAGALEVRAANVTIADTKVRCINEQSWCASLSQHSTFVDSEVGGGANGTTFTSAIGIWTGGPNNVIQRVNVHHTSDGLRTDGGTSILDSWIHSLVVTEIAGVHSDGSQSTAGTAPIVFNHNTIEGGTNDAIFIQASGAVTITNNHLIAVTRGGYQSSFGIGGGNFGGGSPVAGPIVISGNVFSGSWEVSPIQYGNWPSNSSIS